jgi:hypothetical protein
VRPLEGSLSCVRSRLTAFARGSTGAPARQVAPALSTSPALGIGRSTAPNYRRGAVPVKGVRRPSEALVLRIAHCVLRGEPIGRVE